MTKRVVFILLFAVTSFSNAQALKNIGFKAGGMVSQFKYEYNIDGYKYNSDPYSVIRVSAGVYGEFFNLPVFSVIGEINYIEKGAHREIDVTDISNPDGLGKLTDVDAYLKYINISILSKVRLDGIYFSPYLLLGPKVDFEVGRDVHSALTPLYNGVQKIRFGFKAGVGTELKLWGINFISEVLFDKDLGYLYDSGGLQIANYGIDFRTGAFINL